MQSKKYWTKFRNQFENFYRNSSSTLQYRRQNLIGISKTVSLTSTSFNSNAVQVVSYRDYNPFCGTGDIR